MKDVERVLAGHKIEGIYLPSFANNEYVVVYGDDSASYKMSKESLLKVVKEFVWTVEKKRVHEHLTKPVRWEY